MYHCTILYVKPPVKIGSAGMLAAARTPSTAGKPITAGPPATASSKGTSEMLVTPAVQAIAGRRATVTHQDLKGSQQQQEYLPKFGCEKQQ
jgi:hypothetical protein